MASGSEDISAELICPVCLNQYVKPKSLPCSHTFCETCLNAEIFAAINRGAASEKGFHCPVCKAFINAPQPPIPITAWSRSFPTVTALNNIIEKMTNNCPSHPTQERNLFCLNCKDLLCTTCAWESHKECPNVANISAAAERAKGALKSYIGPINAIPHDRLPTAESLDVKLKELDKMHDEVLKDITNSASSARESISNREQILLNKLNLAYTAKRQKLMSMSFSRKFVSNAKNKISRYVMMDNKLELLHKFKLFCTAYDNAVKNIKISFAFDMDQEMFNFCSHSKYKLGSCAKSCMFYNYTSSSGTSQ
ncbi:tripartite motif-containing protein 2-like [Gigantopelta aegis]|uniref:tripartite motif-containing protein 2-like n=1 Tax=Gigantopelta aegis TaxID=1735272 RepID=UPI001B889EE5|nr:tripartite motif-containing protein 2-like [Gigantopelta aegis]